MVVCMCAKLWITKVLSPRILIFDSRLIMWNMLFWSFKIPKLWCNTSAPHTWWLTSCPRGSYSNSQRTSNLLLNLYWPPSSTLPEESNTFAWSHEENKGKSFSCKSSSLKHLKPILCSGSEKLWEHISHGKQGIKSCQDFSPLHFHRSVFPSAFDRLHKKTSLEEGGLLFRCW